TLRHRGWTRRRRCHVPSPLGRAVRATVVRRARRADPLGERVAADPRRRLHVVYGNDDPRRRGVAREAGQQDVHAGRNGSTKMSAATDTTVTTPTVPPSDIVRVHVPARSWRSELRAIKIVW